MISKLVLRLLDIYKSKIYTGSLSNSIDVASLYAKILFRYQLPIYNLCAVESYLLNEVSLIFDADEYSLDEDGSERVLFVVTQAYLTGGHTRLMENLSLMLSGNKDLLITRDCAPAVKSRLSNYFSNVIECVRRSSESSVDHIVRLVKSMKCYDRVVLNVHPDDVYSILASGMVKKINKKAKFFFINHADHVASYGATVADFWYEVSLYGRSLDNKRGIKGFRGFLGIPINRPDEFFFKSFTYPNISEVRNFFTAASSVKYEPYKKQSIFPLLRKIFSINDDFRVTVVGPNLFRNFWWWKIWLQNKRRLSIFKPLPYDQYMEVTKKADYYIDSYPVPGGTAFVEQFLQGVPCIGLKTAFYGYTPLEIIKSDDIGQALNVLRHPPESSELTELQGRIFEVHGYSLVKKRFLGSLNEGLVFENPMLDYADKLKSNNKVPNRYFRFIFSRDLLRIIWQIGILKAVGTYTRVRTFR